MKLKKQKSGLFLNIEIPSLASVEMRTIAMGIVTRGKLFQRPVANHVVNDPDYYYL